MQYFDNNENLKSELRDVYYKYNDNVFKFKSDLGIFSKDKIDEGSKVLVETYLKYGRGNITALDMGCGVGFIGIVLTKLMNLSFDMVDVNNRAIHLTNMNIKSNKIKANVFVSDMYEKIDKKYDLIITNPPIRAGKGVYLTILTSSFNYLNDDGELWFVMRNNHGVKTVVKDLNETFNASILKKDRGYYIVKVTRRNFNEQ